MKRVLIVEDEAVIRHELRRVLTRYQYDVVDVGDVAAAEAAGLANFDIILTDLRLPGASGDALIERAQGVPVVVMTAYGTVRSAVEAIKRGAADYLTKPFDPDELALVLGRVLKRNALEKANAALRYDLQQQWQVEGIVGESPSIQRILKLVSRVAPSETTVLILGESGTGKELVARAIHAQSKRAEAAFIPVNCAAIPEGLIESELFGHERGAFTGANRSQKGLFEAADGGTLFLDEVGELPASAQARLLRVLQEGEVRSVGSTRPRRVNTRIVAATHRDLPKRVEAGSFREDLFFRLRVFEMRLPPLRERGQDILLLAQSFLDKACARGARPPLSFSDDAKAIMLAHPWRGNVRELENAVERAVILHEGGPVQPELLGLLPQASTSTQGEQPQLSLEAYFKAFVLAHQASLSETQLAKRLGISRKSLWERRQRLNIPRP